VIVSSACLAGACVALPLRAHLALLSRPLATINYAFRDIVVHPADMLMWLAMAFWGLSRWLSRQRTPWDWGPRLLLLPLVGLKCWPSLACHWLWTHCMLAIRSCGLASCWPAT
jgi:hypothetical protein